jgi:hypothetical protein
MHDDGSQMILPVPEASERVAGRLREAKAILAAAGFAGAGVAEQERTLLIRVAPADFARLRDQAFREGLVARLKSLGYAFIALDLTPDGTEGGASDPHGVAGSALA